MFGTEKNESIFFHDVQIFSQTLRTSIYGVRDAEI